MRVQYLYRAGARIPQTIGKVKQKNTVGNIGIGIARPLISAIVELQANKEDKVKRMTVKRINEFLAPLNESSCVTLWAGYENGRCHVWRKYGTGRQTLFAGTARECMMYLNGYVEGRYIGLAEEIK